MNEWQKHDGFIGLIVFMNWFHFVRRVTMQYVFVFMLSFFIRYNIWKNEKVSEKRDTESINSLRLEVYSISDGIQLIQSILLALQKYK